MPEFRQVLEEDVVVLFDGAMGTELYRRGVFINRCYDDLSRSEPETVRQVHADYRRAGARALETNTFGANRYQLQAHGLEDEVDAINRAAVRLAREVAGDELLVAGSIGPLGVRLEPYGPTAREEARGVFREQASALAGAGADLLVCETFSDLDELGQAVAGCRSAADLPVLAQATVQPDGRTSYGDRPAEVARAAGEAGADAVGLNCSVGPAVLVEAVREMAGATDLPVSAMPNAGLPREVRGRKMYLASPEYMAGYTRKLVEAGARIVGGCCGTGPEHIRRMAGQLRALASRPEAAEVRIPGPEEPEEEAVEPVPLAERSTWGRKLAEGRPVVAAELRPPKGADPGEFLRDGRRLAGAGVDAVAVPDAPRASMRMGVVAAASLLQREAGVEALAHYTCRDRNLLAMGTELLGAQALGVRNLMLVTGDPPKMGPYGEATAVFDVDSIGLTNLVTRLNGGRDLGGHPLGSRTSFVIGVAANPAAEDLESELERWYWKVDAGAEYAVTQPIFDPGRLASFLERIEGEGTRIPVVASVWPLGGVREAEYLHHEVPGIDVSAGVLESMREAEEGGAGGARREGVRIARRIAEAVAPMCEGIQVVVPSGGLDRALATLEAVDAAFAGDEAEGESAD